MSDDIKPDGTKAKNVKEYVDAWRSLAAEVTACIPGAELHSFDPGLGLLLPRHHVVQHVPIEVARALAAERAALRELRGRVERLRILASLVTVRQVMDAGDAAIEASGLNPYCLAEGLAQPDDRIDVSHIVGWPEGAPDDQRG